jgi:alanine dehydrogenase
LSLLYLKIFKEGIIAIIFEIFAVGCTMPLLTPMSENASFIAAAMFAQFFEQLR